TGADQRRRRGTLCHAAERDLLRQRRGEEAGSTMRYTTWLLVVAASMSVACSTERATAPGTARARSGAIALSVVSGNNQSAPVNSQLAQPVRVQATDSTGAPQGSVVID